MSEETAKAAPSTPHALTPGACQTAQHTLRQLGRLERNHARFQRPQLTAVAVKPLGLHHNVPCACTSRRPSPRPAKYLPLKAGPRSVIGELASRHLKTRGPSVHWRNVPPATPHNAATRICFTVHSTQRSTAERVTRVRPPQPRKREHHIHLGGTSTKADTEPESSPQAMDQGSVQWQTVSSLTSLAIS